MVVPEPPGLPDGIYSADGRALTLEQAVAEWESIPGDGPLVVYVSETHDNVAHHQVQAEILLALMRRFPARCALGMEMFPRPLQPLLDEFSAGGISAAELKERSDWDEIWGFDFSMYAPLLELVQLQGSALLALNAPKALTRKLAKVGPAGLSEEERDALPSTIDLPSDEHRAMIADVLRSVHEMDDATFERFYAAQRAWDSTMAQSVAEFLARGSDVRALVVIAGGYHIYGGLGIPRHVDAAVGHPVRRVIVIPVDTAERRFGPEDFQGADAGDYYVLSRGPTGGSHP